MACAPLTNPCTARVVPGLDLLQVPGGVLGRLPSGVSAALEPPIYDKARQTTTRSVCSLFTVEPAVPGVYVRRSLAGGGFVQDAAGSGTLTSNPALEGS
jgi:hypothetical protein